jgi:sigma-E factor negative regulatory protein RseC
VVTADNSFGARPGDTVELELAGRMELRLSLLIWVVPLVGLVAGAVAGMLIGGRLAVDEDLGVLAGAVAGFALAFLFLRPIDRKAARDVRLVPRVARVTARASCTDQASGVEP